MKLQTLVRMIVVAGMALGPGCANEPGPLGSRLIPPGDLTQADTLTVTALTTSGYSSIPDSLAASLVVAVGRTSTFEAWGLVLFDGFPITLDSIVVQSAELRLRATYRLGDSLAQLSLAVRKALASWQRSNFTYQDLRSPGFYEEPARSTHSLGVVGDTADVVIPLDTALVNSWFGPDSLNPNHGIVLEPTNSAVIKGFVSPQLWIVYDHPDSAQVDTMSIPATFGNYRFIGAAPDTSFLLDSTRIRLRAGAAYRAVIPFDISPVPGFSAIHRATLELTADTLGADFSTAVSDSLVLMFIDEFGIVPTLRILSDPPQSAGQKIYRFNITPYVQFWTQGLGLPRVAVRTNTERNGVDGFLLHGSATADPALKPRLHLIYSSTTRP